MSGVGPEGLSIERHWDIRSPGELHYISAEPGNNNSISMRFFETTWKEREREYERHLQRARTSCTEQPIRVGKSPQVSVQSLAYERISINVKTAIDKPSPKCMRRTG